MYVYMYCVYHIAILYNKILAGKNFSKSMVLGLWQEKFWQIYNSLIATLEFG